MFDKVTVMLRSLYGEDLRRIQEDWHDEASEAAVAGNPQRAGYIEHMADRINDPKFCAPKPKPRKPKSKLILPEGMK